MTGQPTWFGPPERSLLGWWHVPTSGAARAVAVVVPPFAFEQAVSIPAFRYLADRLADEGVAVLRTDLDGLGDSAGDQNDPGRIRAWKGSILTAVDEARRSTDAPVVLVGMRGGALLAALAAEAVPDLFGLVLWDAVGTGRAFMREQRALRLMGLGGLDQPTEGFEGLGFELGKADADELRAVDLAEGSGVLAPHALVLTRSGRRPDQALESRLAAQDVTWSEAEGQDGLLMLDQLAVVVPRRTCEDIVSWVLATAPTQNSPVRTELRSDAVMALPGHDEPVVETIQRLGPVGLFGIRTSAPRPRGLTALLIGNESRVGPARLWVETARQLAAHGIDAVRFDLSGLGDSPVREFQSPQVSFAPEALDDVRTVAEVVSPDDPSRVVLGGLCASAYASVEAALSFGARGVFLVNMLPDFVPPETVAGSIDARRRAAQPTPPMILSLGRRPAVKRFAARMPPSTWRLIDRLGILRSPVAPLARLVRDGIDVVLWCGTDDAKRYQSFAASHIEHIKRTGSFRFVVDPELDHGMLRAVPRRAAAQAFLEQCLAIADRGVAGPTQTATVSPSL